MKPTICAYGPAGGWSAVKLIAGREITTRVRTKSFVVSTVITLLVIVAGGIAFAAFTDNDGKGPDTKNLAVSNVDAYTQQAITQVGTDLGVHITTVDSPDSRAMVVAGDADVGLVAEGSGYRVFSKDGLDENLEKAIAGGTTLAKIDTTLRASGIDPTSVGLETKLALEQTEPEGSVTAERLIMVWIGTFLLVGVIFGGGLMVATGVVEEKSSRIVEILLSTVRPDHLLWGKILGIGIVYIGQTILTAAVAFTTSLATGLLTVPEVALSMAAVQFAFLVLGFLFFAALYAGIGAMVSRQEEVGGATAPLLILGMALMYATIFGIQSADSTIIKILAWIPPFSTSVVPMRVATDDATGFEVAGTLMLTTGACAIAVWIASRIYNRSILHTGAKVPWKEALGIN